MERPHVRKPRAKKHLRMGRGFSLGEIKSAGSTVQDLKLHRLPIDWLRRSTHSQNVKLLKTHFTPTKAPSKKRKTKK